MKLVEEIFRNYLAQIFIALTCCWLISTFVFTPVQLIEIENSLLIAAGVGVSVAYLTSAISALRSGSPTQGEILALGIWLAWIAIAGERIYSLIGRAMGKDITFFNTDLHTGLIFLTTFGGVCHLAAPEVIDGRFPRRAWMVLGLTAAGGVVILTAMALFVGF